jgi:hypothetical protein
VHIPSGIYAHTVHQRNVPGTVSHESKLPVSLRTAAEAANQFFSCLNHIRLFRNIPALKAQVRHCASGNFCGNSRRFFIAAKRNRFPAPDTKTLLPSTLEKHSRVAAPTFAA